MTLMEDLLGPGGLAGFATEVLVGKLTKENRAAMAEALKNWLISDARKANAAELPDYIKEFSQRIDRLCETVEFGIVDGQTVVKAFASNEATLKALTRGTNWFDPCDDVVSIMISALWKS